MRIILCLSLLLLLLTAAWAGIVRFPDPPSVPSDALYENGAKALKARRADLLKQKQDYLDDLGNFNAAVANPIPKEQVEYYKIWQARLVANSKAYCESVARFEAELKQPILRNLRSALRQTQETIRRLNRSIQSDVGQLEEWGKTTEASVARSKQMGMELVLDALITVPQEHVETIYSTVAKEANSELQRVVTLLTHETDAARRAQLHSAFNLLTDQRDAIRNVQALLQNLREAQKTKRLSDLSDLPEKEKLIQGIQQLLSTLENPALQESFKSQFGVKLPALTFLGKAASRYCYGKKIVDAAYEVTIVSLAWARISQFNRNTDEYLKSMSVLSERMEKIVEAIQEMEGK